MSIVPANWNCYMYFKNNISLKKKKEIHDFFSASVGIFQSTSVFIHITILPS